jgi:hypothetical protein
VALSINGYFAETFQRKYFCSCFYHGHRSCYEGQKKFMRTGLTMGDKAIETDKRDEAVTMVYKGNHMIYW